jgi:hypothetical protein
MFSVARHELHDPLALTDVEEDQIVAVLLLTGVISRYDVYEAANHRIYAELVRPDG